jgi:tape measure domain-containing protein
MAVSNVELRVDARQALNALQQVNRASTDTQRSINGLKGAVGRLAGAFAAIQALKFIVAKTSELETQTRSIETLTGSVEKATQIIQQLQQLGAITPFTSAELIDAAKRLNSFGVSADKVVETTRRLGDIAGATGANLGELTLAYGQVIAKGRLQGEELLQFQERGIALQEELRKMYGMTGEEFQKALSKGRISAEAVEVAVVRLTEQGGKYANGAIAQSETLAGKFSTLVDGVEGIARKIGEVLKPAMKEILDLGIAVVNQINAALAGPDYKKANDRLFNIRSRMAELKDEINAAEKAGLKLQSGLEIRGVDGQVLGGGVPVLPAMRFEMQQLEKEAKFLEGRMKSLRQMSAAKPAAAKTTPPPLLAEKGDGKASRISMEDLLGVVIQQRLQENKALMETQKINALNAVSMTANAEQAKRMVDFAFQYKEIQLEVNALQGTLAKREQFRDLIIAKSKDKEDTRFALLQKEDEIRSAITVRQQELNTIFAKHQQQIITASAEDQKRLDQQVKVGQERMQQLTDEAELLQAKLVGNEAEVMLRQQIRDIMKESAGLDAKNVEDQVKKVESLKKQLTEQEQIKAIYEDIGMSIKSGVVDAIQGAVDGTKTLGDAASQVLRNISNRLLDVAVNFALFGAMSGTGTGGGLLGGFFKPRANGGSVMAGQGYLVGERGPELFMPGRSGGIARTGSFGGAVSVVVNVDAGGTSVEGNELNANQLGRIVGAAVQAEIVKMQRPGGLLASTR